MLAAMRSAHTKGTAQDGALLVLLPLAGAPLLHAPILYWDLLPGLAQPLDLGIAVGGAPLFGRTKTIRGVLAMTGGCLLATFALSAVPSYWTRLPDPVKRLGPLRLGVRLGLGVSLGELPNSFAKRRLGIASGDRAPGAAKWLLAVTDQVDFLPAIWLALRPAWRVSPRDALRAAIAIALVHLALNAVGWAAGIRSQPV